MSSLTPTAARLMLRSIFLDQPDVIENLQDILLSWDDKESFLTEKAYVIAEIYKVPSKGEHLADIDCLMSFWLNEYRRCQ